MKDKIEEIWFTSDTHFGHTNILKYCDRPFANIEEHDEYLISQWNKAVKPNDNVYHLGDFAFGNDTFIKNIIRRLNGKIHFITGNHDKIINSNKTIQDSFASYQQYCEIKVSTKNSKQKQSIVMFHYPIESWNKCYHGAWHLHGHCHGTFPSTNFQARVDVGVDIWEYTPVSYEQIKNHMSGKEFKPIDHHGKRTK